MSSGPLNISLNTDAVKTAVPLFPEQTYVRCRLAKVQQDHVEGKGDVIKFEYDLVEPTATADGSILKPGDFGSKVFETVQLYDKNTKPGEGAPKWALEKIAKRLDGFLGTSDLGNAKGKPARPPFNPELVPTLIGQEAFFKFKNKTGEYTGQDIASVTFPGDVAGA